MTKAENIHLYCTGQNTETRKVIGKIINKGCIKIYTYKFVLKRRKKLKFKYLLFPNDKTKITKILSVKGMARID